MAQELSYFANPDTDSGFTIVARVYDSLGVQVGTDVTCAEVGTLAIYLGDMPTAPAGDYVVRFFDGGTVFVKQGEIFWDGTQEITLVDVNTALAALPTAASIADAVFDEPSADHVAAGSVGALLADTKTSADDKDVNIVSVTGTNVTNVDDFKADSTGTAAAVWDALIASHTTAGTFGEAAQSTDANIVSVTGTGVGNINAFKADVSSLALEATVTSEFSTLTSLINAGVVVNGASRLAIATAVEAGLLNEGDGQQLLDAITQKINTDLDVSTLEENAIAAAVVAAFESENLIEADGGNKRFTSAGLSEALTQNSSAVADGIWSTVVPAEPTANTALFNLRLTLDQVSILLNQSIQE